MSEMKTKTAFQFLKKELPLPKQITVDDADGTRIGTNGIYVSDITVIMDKYAEHRVEQYLATKKKLSKPIKCECSLKLKQCTRMCEHMENKFSYIEDDSAL